jgi:hypothetical protein
MSPPLTSSVDRPLSAIPEIYIPVFLPYPRLFHLLEEKIMEIGRMLMEAYITRAFQPSHWRFAPIGGTPFLKEIIRMVLTNCGYRHAEREIHVQNSWHRLSIHFAFI